MPSPDTGTPRASIVRPMLAIGLAIVWLAVIALEAAPTQAAPGSGPATTTASFAPVWLDSSLVGDPTPAAAAPSPTASSRPIAEAGRPPAPTARPRTRQPAVAAGVVVKQPRTTHAVRGIASWYCKAGVSTCMAVHPDRAGVADMYAAAGPALRRAICGSEASNCWRGRRVLVNGVAVVLADWCQCYGGQGSEKLIDLYWDAWVRVPSVESGVTVRW